LPPVVVVVVGGRLVDVVVVGSEVDVVVGGNDVEVVVTCNEVDVVVVVTGGREVDVVVGGRELVVVGGRDVEVVVAAGREVEVVVTCPVVDVVVEPAAGATSVTDASPSALIVFAKRRPFTRAPRLRASAECGAHTVALKRASREMLTRPPLTKNRTLAGLRFEGAAGPTNASLKTSRSPDT